MQLAVDEQHIGRTLEMVTQLLKREYSAGMIASTLDIPLKQAESLVAQVKRTNKHS